MSIISNFTADWSTHLMSQLSELGYDLPSTITTDELTYQFFSVMKRRIVAVPRTVHESTVLDCPPEFLSGYEDLKNKFLTGLDVTPHLSHKINEIEEEDALLNDWGIHHFHLGQEKADGSIKRTGPVLFALVKQYDVYFISIKMHGKGYSPWSEQDLIRVLHSEWPSAIEMYRLKGVTGLTQTVDDDAVKLLRASGVQTLVEVESGAVYGPIGGGYSTAKTSVDVLRTADYYLDQIKLIEKHFLDNYDYIAERIFDKTQAVLPILHLKLHIFNDGLYVVEQKSKVAFLVHQHS